MPDKSGNSTLDCKMRVEEQAARWLVRMQSGACSAEDIVEHKAWLNANLMHLRAYRRLESLWEQLGQYGNHPDILLERRLAKTASRKPAKILPHPAQHCVQQQAVRQQEATAQQNSGYTRRNRSGWLPFALAASLVVAFLGINFDIGDFRGDLYEEDVYQTAIGEQDSLKLDDGSVVLLDTQTRLREDFSAQQRRIVLEKGQARFDVAHDKTRPFVVEAGNGKITALGTAFVVKKAHGEVLVTLLEGSVAVAKDLPAIADEFEPVTKLEAGQQLAYSDKGMSEADTVDIPQVIAWQQGRLIFEDHSLADVIEDLNRYSKRKILLGDQSLESIRVTGVFKSGDTRKAIQALTTYFSMQVTNDANGNLILLPEG